MEPRDATRPKRCASSLRNIWTSANLVKQDDNPAAITPSGRRLAQQAAAIAGNGGARIVALNPYPTSIHSLDVPIWRQGIGEFRARVEATHPVGATRVRLTR